MKIRNIAVGYCYADGKIIIHPQESGIVRKIFTAYLQGKSLLQIAQRLNERKIEYMPGVIAWNKARVMRVLEDKRYLGHARHPAIIDPEIHESVIRIKESRNNQRVDRPTAILRLNVSVRCPKCNSLMNRRVDSRRAVASRWDCRNPECHCVIGKNDETLLSEISELLNQAIENPDMITIPTEKESEPSAELIRLNNEISRIFDSIQIDRETARKKMLEYAALKYRETDSSVSIAQRLKDTFTNAEPLKANCPFLFERTVEEIRLYTDGTMGIVLTNKQEIRSGGSYADSSRTT